MSLKTTFHPLFLSNPFPISFKPLTINFPHKKLHFDVHVTKNDRLVIRKKDEAETFYKSLQGKTTAEKKVAISAYIEKQRKKIKDGRKWPPIVFGNVMGKGQWPIIYWILSSSGIRHEDEEMAIKEEDVKIKEVKIKEVKMKKNEEDMKKPKEEEVMKEEEDQAEKEFQNWFKEEEEKEKKKEVEDLIFLAAMVLAVLAVMKKPKEEEVMKEEEEKEKKKEVEDLIFLAAMVLEVLAVALKMKT